MTGWDRVRTIRLRELPVGLWLEAKQHTDELLREFAIMAAGRENHTADDELPGRLVTLVGALRQQYGAGSAERDEQLFAAADAGVAAVDVEMEVPAAAGAGVQALGDLLDQADEYCRQGKHLLTLATSPQLVEFRQWYLNEVVAQLGGAAPTPWPMYRGQSRHTTRPGSQRSTPT